MAAHTRNSSDAHAPRALVRVRAAQDAQRENLRLLFRVDEAAEILGMSRTQAYVEIRAGRLGYRRIGADGPIRIPLEALEAYARAR